ncbi:MAG: hypothetical protein ACREC3_03345, partial [Methyloceanibacter sp.]
MVMDEVVSSPSSIKANVKMDHGGSQTVIRAEVAVAIAASFRILRGFIDLAAERLREAAMRACLAGTMGADSLTAGGEGRMWESGGKALGRATEPGHHAV